jgi:hypothetical protein
VAATTWMEEQVSEYCRKAQVDQLHSDNHPNLFSQCLPTEVCNKKIGSIRKVFLWKGAAKANNFFLTA